MPRLFPPRSGQSDSTPVALEPADYLGADVGDELPINIVGCYPGLAWTYEQTRGHW